MEVFQRNVDAVLEQMAAYGYSKHSISGARRKFSELRNFLNENRIIYTPEVGKELVSSRNGNSWFSGSYTVKNACVTKLNDVYRYGYVRAESCNIRKPYSLIELAKPYADAVDEFIAAVSAEFSAIQLKNCRRRCVLFMKFLQYRGIPDIEEISYTDIYAYHTELSRLKQVSRIVEESSLHQFLQFLSDSRDIRPGLGFYMYALEKGQAVALEEVITDEKQDIPQLQISDIRAEPAELFRIGMGLVDEEKAAGYNRNTIDVGSRTIKSLYLFLDFNRLKYTPEFAEAWSASAAVGSCFHGSSLSALKRTIFLLSGLFRTGRIDFNRFRLHGISGLDRIPDWCRQPLLDFAEKRRKEKLDEDTVKNDVYSILRFLEFISEKGLDSFQSLTPELVLGFSLYDRHLTSEGKNACNCRIRRFLKYLYREGFTDQPSLHVLLGYKAADTESVVVTLREDEIADIGDYINNAENPLQLRDSAILLLGTEMGIRGCDIVNLRLSDIDWKQRTISFMQEKTDTAVELPMPVSVGNALFRYLKDGRPRGAKHDFLFASCAVPYRPLSRHVCLGALKRALPERKIYGSGFHVTRKTFSTEKLRQNIPPEMIAAAIGHRDISCLEPYLSLDDQRMMMCPLVLSEIGIPMDGGAG